MATRKKARKRVRLGDSAETHRLKASDLFHRSQQRAHAAYEALRNRNCHVAHANAVSAHVNARLALRENEQGQGAADVYMEAVRRTARLLRELSNRCMLAVLPKPRS